MNPQQQNHSEPSLEDLEWFSKVEQGYIGLEKPKVTHVTEPADPYSYKRRKAAEKLGVTEDQLNDEPDNDAGDREQAYA